MAKKKWPTLTVAQRTLGKKAAAAIAAVEGLRLSPESRKRLDALEAAGLTPEERRAAILKHYKKIARSQSK